ncbi:hypothetical protein GALMADRAFT_156507 [Galerina marginata CBS 339.88]|uniref:BTB domain-containing protein n=1 Tax=Galerina marginata (strain CBS 339.88) TaxID=685588 RepID=A0A067T953_GALM3|nr:hypothetical protein GALMADRAFT_156507 [Galerina marginata CBS 339.88]
MTTHSSPSHYDSYYLGVIIIKVQNCRFTVPQHLFQVSPKFASRIKPLRPGEHPPIIDLEKVERIDFENFLLVLILGPGAAGKISASQWMVVLGLSTEWGFNQVRQQAINVLLSKPDNTSYVRLTVTAMGLGVGACFRLGCLELIGRDEPISMSEAQHLGDKVAYRLCLLREKRLTSGRRIGLADIEKTFSEIIEGIDRKDATHGPPVVSLWNPLRPPASTQPVTTEERPTKRPCVGND